MRYHVLALVAVFALGGCATFKELSPKPELSPAERGYVELKDKDENFTLEKDGKYFIRFPRPERDQFYVVLSLSAKSSLTYYFTHTFDDGKGPREEIPDETPTNDSLSTYAVNTTYLQYYWVIENVKTDLELRMRYRYVPQWRFTFENKYAQFKQQLAENTVERSTYNSIDRNFNYSTFPFTERLSQLTSASQNIKALQEELVKLEKVFPRDIAASRDTAYLNYVALRRETDDEAQFQENYTKVLTLFQKERETQGNVKAFLQAAPTFTAFFGEKSKFPNPIVEKARDVLTQRIAAAPGYYDDQLAAKRDAKVIKFDPPMSNARELYQALGATEPASFRTMADFVERFNVEAAAMQSVNERFRQIDNVFGANPPLSSEALFADLIGKVAEIKGKIPESRAVSFEKYGRYACATMLDGEIRNAGARANLSETLFSAGQRFVLDANARSWATAEATLKEMHYNISYADVQAVADERGKLVRAFESDLFNRIKTASQQRVDAFVQAHQAAIDNVPALYRDSAFLPVHEISFSALGAGEVQRKRKEVQDYIDKLKYNDFPAASIRAIFKDFSRNINDKGVERARAIVEHGKNYRGDDKQLKSIVSECDPTVAKWIVRPKEYRNLYALPVTTNRNGVNEYLFRVQLQIPSEAQFPVFEINIKLPAEVAAKAGTQQWYESITINKTPIKNEGRFTITSPTADNNYESQISPVQMDKEGRNILEVRFTYPGFKVFEISTMAQVPIIRKN